MISREEAIQTLVTLEESDILDDELQSKLMDIRVCIEEELQGWHFWGASDDDYMELHIARRADLWTKEAEEKCAELDKYYTFTPAPYEVNDVGRDDDPDEAAGVYV